MFLSLSWLWYLEPTILYITLSASFLISDLMNKCRNNVAIRMQIY